MSDMRKEWTCWVVPGDGEGPGRYEPRIVRERQWTNGGKGAKEVVVPISAVEAAEHYAMTYFEDDEEWGIEDGSGIYVGVEVDAERAIAFRVTKRVKLEAQGRIADEIKPEALLPPRPATEDDAA